MKKIILILALLIPSTLYAANPKAELRKAYNYLLAHPDAAQAVVVKLGPFLDNTTPRQLATIELMGPEPEVRLFWSEVAAEFYGELIESFLE